MRQRAERTPPLYASPPAGATWRSMEYDGERWRRAPAGSRVPSAVRLAAFGLLCFGAGCAAPSLYARLPAPGAAPEAPREFELDAVVVPGGGLATGLQPAPWVAARLDTALAHDARTRDYLVLSRGTTHKPPPVDSRGFPMDESEASAIYLKRRGVEAGRILLDTWSVDTIGNAAFARLMHADPRGWRRLHVVTSEFHVARTRAIFEWVFALSPAPRPPVELTFEAVPNAGMAPEQVTERGAKEARAVETLRETRRRVTDLVGLHAFVFGEHAAYTAPRGMAWDEKGGEAERARGALASTY